MHAQAAFQSCGGEDAPTAAVAAATASRASSTEAGLAAQEYDQEGGALRGSSTPEMLLYQLADREQRVREQEERRSRSRSQSQSTSSRASGTDGALKATEAAFDAQDLVSC